MAAAQILTLDSKVQLNDKISICHIVLDKEYMIYAFTSLNYEQVYMVKYLPLKDLSDHIKDELFFDWHVHQIKQFRIGITSDKAMLVPSVLQDVGFEELFCRWYTIEPEEKLLHCPLNEQDSCLFTISAKHYAILKKRWPSVDIVYQGAANMQYYKRLLTSEKRTSVFISLDDTSSNISVWHQQDLYLHHVGAQHTVNDVMYTVLNAIHQHQWDLKEVSVFIHGNTLMCQQLTELLSYYVDKVQIVPPSPIAQMPQSTEVIPKDPMFHLTALITCVS